MSILSWNINGMVSKLDAICRYINSYKWAASPEVVFLSEIKGGEDILTLFCRKTGYKLISYVASIGSSGGVAILAKWNVRCVKISTFENRGVIADVYLYKNVFRLIGIYGGFDTPVNKRILDWCSKFFCSNMIITGDFNRFSPFSVDEDLIDGYLSSGLGPSTLIVKETGWINLFLKAL